MMGCGKAFFLQMQPNFVTHLKFMGHSMLIMLLFVFGNGFMQDVMNLLVAVLNVLNKSGGFISFRLNMGRFFLCRSKRQCNIKGT